jgi:hypothetical protein
MQTTRNQTIISKTAAATSANGHTKGDRVAGVMLASAISAGFWVTAFALVLPSVGITPAPWALAFTGFGIAGVVSATFFALTNQD